MSHNFLLQVAFFKPLSAVAIFKPAGKTAIYGKSSFDGMFLVCHMPGHLTVLPNLWCVTGGA